mmetsp:Transcript_451/g.1033  ORF Transcript_451/g.1033 Transcript_451/m.1033 type:complete len:292 (+) Transcript_451:894-1769(+)
MPYLVTMASAICVACSKSDEAPEVMLSVPKMSSSATRPPMQTSILASICLRVMEVMSFSGNCDTIPRAWPRGTMVALWTGSAPGVYVATRAWPPSWYAVNFLVSSLMTADLRSAPMRILSLAYSNWLMVTAARPSNAALSAAMLARLASSAPEKPGVPRAMISKSTSRASGMPRVCTSRICRRPSTSGLGTMTWRSKRPGRIRAPSSVSGKFVAPMTMMPSVGLKPSSSTRSWLSVIFMYIWSLGLRLPPMASISSIKRMHGACCLAALNKSRTRRAPTPTNISSNSEPEA